MVQQAAVVPHVGFGASAAALLPIVANSFPLPSLTLLPLSVLLCAALALTVGSGATAVISSPPTLLPPIFLPSLHATITVTV